MVWLNVSTEPLKQCYASKSVDLVHSGISIYQCSVGVQEYTPRYTTGEKPSYLLFGIDFRSPTEAELIPPTEWSLISVTDYREELFLSLSSARQLAVETIQEAQRKYKAYYDQKTTADRF